MNILLTSTARRIDMVGFFQIALKNAGIDGKVIAADPEYNAPSLQAGDENYVIPEQTDSDYMEKIIEICKEHQVDCLVPLNDWEVPQIAAHKKELEKLGVAVFAPLNSGTLLAEKLPHHTPTVYIALYPILQASLLP